MEFVDGEGLARLVTQHPMNRDELELSLLSGWASGSCGKFFVDGRRFNRFAAWLRPSCSPSLKDQAVRSNRKSAAQAHTSLDKACASGRLRRTLV